MYYIEKNNKIIGYDNLAENLENILKMPQYTDLELKEVSEGFKIIDFELLNLKEAELKTIQKERQRLDMLSLTSADVERALYKAKGLDFEDILNMVSSSLTDSAEEVDPIDIKALKIELKANNFYRGNPYVEKVGALLGISSQDLDYLFENKSLPIEGSEVNDD